jgi:ThiF family
VSAVEGLNRTILLCRDYVLDELSDEEICQFFQSLRVLCISDLPNLSSHSGQTTLVTLVSLLSRMGMQVGLSIPEVALLSPQPPLLGLSLRESLIASSETLITGATVHCDSDFNPDVIFVLGDSKLDAHHAVSWRLNGTSHSGALAMEGISAPCAWTAEWPVGAMVSAALAANEAFKHVMRRIPLRDQAVQVFFEASRSCHWNFDSVPLPKEAVDLGHVDLISAGAVAQATLYALMRFPKIQLRGRVFDDDLTVASNLNRNMLSTVSDVGQPKVHVVARRCATKLQIEPVPYRFFGKSFGILELCQRVLVGVDDIPSRWEVQRHAPGWVAVSGTSHFSVSSSAHSVGEPCCGCLHPVDDPAGANPIPTVAFVSFWAGLAMAVRLLREALVSPYSTDRQHLWLTPLRMDLPRAGMWLPVAPRRDCPVHCLASRLQ